MAESYDLTVVMPFYNEHATLRVALERLLKTELSHKFEVLLVDDGSQDGSAETIADLVDGERVRLLTHERNMGKGAAIQTGVGSARAALLSILDADLEYDPQNFQRLIDAVHHHDAKVVYGVRSFGSQTAYSFWFVIGNRMVSLWTSFLFNVWVRDIETCLKMMPVEVWQSLGLGSRGFGIEAETTAKLLRKGHQIFEVPIDYRARTREEGKKLNWTDGVAALWLIFRIRVFGK
ncbi:MAG TPA: glycosyltransferase family 2 protein [Actinomycetota bacterium]|nr:glycosyltransferase family 2 protein [Actinomycetota bacterium]